MIGTAQFHEALRHTHTVVNEAVILTATGEEVEAPLLDGSVTLDATADTRTTADLTFDPEYVPTDPNDPLSPFGNEIRLGRGIQYSDGTQEIMPLGVVVIEDTNSDDTGTSLDLTVAGMDRSSHVIDAVFESTFTQAPGVLISEAIQDILTEGYPAIEFSSSWATTSYETPSWLGVGLTAQEGDDRWDFCRGLAEAIGHDLHFDRYGHCELTPIPTGSSDPVTALDEGEGGVLVSLAQGWTRSDAVNRVVVTSEAAGGDTVYRGVATDDNVASPTYYGGPFGKKTYPWSPSGLAASAIESDDHAAYVAAVILSLKRGVPQTVEFTSLVNPGLDPYDVAQITRGDVNQNSIIDSLTIPLGFEGVMSGATRATQIA